MVKKDSLDKRYLNYNPNKDYNNGIGIEIVEEVLRRYKTIENYVLHLKSINASVNSRLPIDNSGLVKKVNSNTSNDVDEPDDSVYERAKEAREASLKSIKDSIDESIKRDHDPKLRKVD